MERPAWALPGRLLVRVDLGRAGVSIGQLLYPLVLEPTTTKVMVEYRAKSGRFQCRRLDRRQIEIIQ